MTLDNFELMEYGLIENNNHTFRIMNKFGQVLTGLFFVIGIVIIFIMALKFISIHNEMNQIQKEIDKNIYKTDLEIQTFNQSFLIN